MVLICSKEKKNYFILYTIILHSDISTLHLVFQAEAGVINFIRWLVIDHFLTSTAAAAAADAVIRLTEQAQLLFCYGVVIPPLEVANVTTAPT